MTPSHNREFAGEFLGTLSLVVAGAGVVAATSMVTIPYGLVVIAATFGIVVGLTLIVVGNPEPQIDPAVSLAAVLSGRMKRNLLLPYILFQFLGALAAGVILRMIFPASIESRFLGSTLLGPGVSPIAGILIELAGTFVLSTVALYVSLRVQGAGLKAFLIGLTLFLLIVVMAPLTSASLNPARSAGPALASGRLDDLEVYLIGPTMGGALAGLLSRSRHLKTVKKRPLDALSTPTS